MQESGLSAPIAAYEPYASGRALAQILGLYAVTVPGFRIEDWAKADPNYRQLYRVSLATLTPHQLDTSALQLISDVQAIHSGTAAADHPPGYQISAHAVALHQVMHERGYAGPSRDYLRGWAEGAVHANAARQRDPDQQHKVQTAVAGWTDDQLRGCLDMLAHQVRAWLEHFEPDPPLLPLRQWQLPDEAEKVSPFWWTLSAVFGEARRRATSSHTAESHAADARSAATADARQDPIWLPPVPWLCSPLAEASPQMTSPPDPPPWSTGSHNGSDQDARSSHPGRPGAAWATGSRRTSRP